MKLWVLRIALSIGIASSPFAALAQTPQTLPLWPHVTPEPAQTTAPETDTTKPTDGFISGRRTARLTNITEPTLTVYPPRERNMGSAVLVFPGGGYSILAWDGEGLDPCHWLNSLGITCVLVKYRVPQPNGEEGHYPADAADLEDAQQAMRITRAHASEWHIDPKHIGVMGFSAGGNLAVLMCTHPDDTHVESTPAASEVDTHISAAPDFAIIVYPAYLAVPPEQTALDPTYTPNKFTPPTFLIQAENDSYGKNAIVYYRALMDAHVPAELHYYATGGHGFGMHPAGTPEEHWPHLAADWLRSINVLPAQMPHRPSSGPPTGAATPCPYPQPASTDHPTNASSVTANNSSVDPNCW